MSEPDEPSPRVNVTWVGEVIAMVSWETPDALPLESFCPVLAPAPAWVEAKTIDRLVLTGSARAAVEVVVGEFMTWLPYWTRVPSWRLTTWYVSWSTAVPV